MRGVHVEVEQQWQLLQSGVAQQLRLVADQDGMQLLALVQMHDGFRDLADQIAAIVGRLRIREVVLVFGVGLGCSEAPCVGHVPLPFHIDEALISIGMLA